MSLILEALRKSEAERRRGDAPDLRVELPPPAATKKRARPFAVAAAVALLAVAVLVVLWPGDDGAGDPVPDGAGQGPADATPAGDAGAPTAAADDAADAFPSVDRIEPLDSLTDGAPPPARRVDGEDRLPLAPPPGAAAPAAAAPPPASTPVVASAPAPGQARALPRITELSAGQRQRLPPMKLSLHMWNEDPARRFAVVDGQRRIEGDRVGEATIAAIDREGLVLELDGQRIRVPLP